MISYSPNPAEANLHSIFFDNCPLPYLIVQHPALHILHANIAAAAFFQSTQARLQSGCFTDVLVQADADTHELLKKFGSGSTAPFLLSCKTGDSITRTQVFQNRFADSENQIGIILVPGQAAEHPEIQAELLADMINETSDVLTAADLDFKPLTWSKAAERLYGLTKEQAVGKSLSNYVDIQYNGIAREEVRHSALTAGEWRGEMNVTRPTDKKKLTLLITFKLIRNSQGKPLHYLVSGTDITDRKEAEAKLRESENRFREVADTAPVGIWMSEVENKIIYINETLAAFTGVCPHAFDRTVWTSLIHPDDTHEVLKKFRAHFQQRLPVILIYRLQQQNHGYRWVQDSGTPRFLSDGTFLGYIGSIVDINDTKQREEQLQYQATLMNNVLDSVLTTDMNFTVLSLNKVAEEIYGYTAEEIIGKRLPGLPFNYTNTTKEEALQVLLAEGVWKGEVTIFVNGAERIFLFTVTYVTNDQNKRIGIMAVGREITDRKQIEKQLQQSESFYRNLISDSVNGKLLTNLDGTITFVAPSVQNVLGYDTEEICGRNAFEFVHPEDQTCALQAFQREVSETAEVKFIEVRLLKKDGTWLWCLVRGHNLLANPHINSIVISMHDNSQQKQATDALKESEQRFRMLIKDLKLGVTLENAEGRILMHNKAIADLFRVEEAAFDTANVYDFYKNVVHEDGTPFKRHEWPMLRAASTKVPVENVIAGIPVISPDERVWLLVNSNPVLDEDGNIRHIISSFSDVTERKTLVQRLMEEQVNQQRLLSQATIDGQERERKEIGKELHDNIGQQLATTKLYLDLAKSTTAADNVDMLNRATKSIMDVINEVRSMSHSLVPPTLGDLGLAESVQDLIESIGLVQNLQISFNPLHFDEHDLLENGKLMLYRIIQEALNNIIKHAQASAVFLHLTRKARFVFLEISDNGQGFSLEKVRKGLGLANIRNRAELFGGKVIIKTAPGAGCSIKIMIPCRYIVHDAS